MQSVNFSHWGNVRSLLLLQDNSILHKSVHQEERHTNESSSCCTKVKEIAEKVRTPLRCKNVFSNSIQRNFHMCTLHII
jgi:hypothetical protein